ncbi:MAG: 30S ribosomal protein S9 [Candidatus Kuenenbacteria bacterium]
MPKEEIKKNNKTDEKSETKFTGKYFYAVGRRKTASARVRLYEKGSGKVVVNKKDYKDFFPYFFWQQNLEEPFQVAGLENKFDVDVIVAGSGQHSQSEACRLGISRALVKFNEEFKKPLRVAGFMTRDPRAKERKKPGLKRARRAPQWSKR